MFKLFLKRVGYWYLDLLKTVAVVGGVLALGYTIASYTTSMLPNAFLLKSYVSLIYKAEHTYDAQDAAIKYGMKMVSFAKDPALCSTDVSLAAYVVIDPHGSNKDDRYVLEEWSSRDKIVSHLKEACL